MDVLINLVIVAILFVIGGFVMKVIGKVFGWIVYLVCLIGAVLLVVHVVF